MAADNTMMDANPTSDVAGETLPESGGGDAATTSGLQPENGGGRAGGDHAGSGGHGRDGQTDGAGGQAGGDGEAQAGGAGPSVAVACVFTGQDVWQADMGGGKWQDVDPTWTEPLLQALRDGHGTLRLPHTYLNKHGEEVRSWYTIDCTDTSVTQKNEATGKQRELRLVQMMAPTVVKPLDDAPQEVLADP